MARFGISADNTLGVSVTELRAIARVALKPRKRDPEWRHEVAARLWDSGVHEARILGTIVDDPTLVTREQARAWAADSDSWDTTDGLCMNLLDRTPFAYELATELTDRDEEFVKRAGFALVAVLAWRDKDAPDDKLLPFLEPIRREAHDGRNFVKKAVSWALRHIGKRSATLHPKALAVAEELAGSDDRAERWVGRDAAKELASAKVLERLGLA